MIIKHLLNKTDISEHIDDYLDRVYNAAAKNIHCFLSYGNTRTVCVKSAVTNILTKKDKKRYIQYIQLCWLYIYSV